MVNIKTISQKSGVPYHTIFKVLNGAKSRRINEILKASADLLEERKKEIERLENF